MWDTILNWFKSKQPVVENGHTSWKWIGYIVLFLAGAGVLIYFYIRSWRRGLALAQAQHEKDLLADQAKNLKNQQIIETDKNKIIENTTKIADLTNKIKDIDNSLKTGLEEQRQIHEKIESISDWSGIDKLMGK